MPDKPLPDHVTTPLLSYITQHSLDEDYGHVARRNAERGGPASGSHRFQVLPALVVAAVFGLLIATAAVQTSRQAAASAAGREELVAQINERGEAVGVQQARLGDLRAETADLAAEFETLTVEEQATILRLSRLQVRTGYVAVTGPGVRVIVDDAPNRVDETQVVRDTDLAKLANALWESGAEAISINGVRLTGTSPIRTSARAIHVNNQPLDPPYTVLAIGDPNTMQARFLDTTHGATWFDLSRTLGLVFEMEADQTLSLPSSRLPLLLRADQAGTTQKGLSP